MTIDVDTGHRGPYALCHLRSLFDTLRRLNSYFSVGRHTKIVEATPAAICYSCTLTTYYVGCFKVLMPAGWLETQIRALDSYVLECNATAVSSILLQSPEPATTLLCDPHMVRNVVQNNA